VSGVEIARNTQDIKNILGVRVMSAKSLLSPRKPEIGRTSPPGQEENYDRYSAEGSAAVKSSRHLSAGFSSI
jgi:hypothetical protein